MYKIEGINKFGNKFTGYFEMWEKLFEYLKETHPPLEVKIVFAGD